MGKNEQKMKKNVKSKMKKRNSMSEINLISGGSTSRNSFQMFPDDRNANRRRDKSIHDYSFECSPPSPVHILRNAVHSSPNFQVDDETELVALESKDHSSDLFASYIRFESQFNGSQVSVDTRSTSRNSTVSAEKANVSKPSLDQCNIATRRAKITHSKSSSQQSSIEQSNINNIAIQHSVKSFTNITSEHDSSLMNAPRDDVSKYGSPPPSKASSSSSLISKSMSSSEIRLPKNESAAQIPPLPLHLIEMLRLKTKHVELAIFKLDDLRAAVDKRYGDPVGSVPSGHGFKVSNSRTDDTDKAKAVESNLGQIYEANTWKHGTTSSDITKSSDNVLTSQFVATRKKRNLSSCSDGEAVAVMHSENKFESSGMGIGIRRENAVTNEVRSISLSKQDDRVRNFDRTIPSKSTSMDIQFESINNELAALSDSVEGTINRTSNVLMDITNKINWNNVTKRKRKVSGRNSFHHLPVIDESIEYGTLEVNGAKVMDSKLLEAPQLEKQTTVTKLRELPSGKWRRLLSLYRRSAFLLEQTDESINSRKISLSNESSRHTLRHSVSFNFSRDNFSDLNETTDRRAGAAVARRRRTSIVSPNVDSARLTEFDFGSVHKARDTILRKCGQSEPLEFADIYSESVLRHCRKIGEGVFGEVFMNKTDEGRAIVLKIIPIEGALEVNGEPQKKFNEVLSEIVITQQLSSLRNDKECMTNCFADVIQIRCVQGRYPNHLIDLWELYRDNYHTENDHPDVFGDDQLYIVFELANGGQDLEAFQFTNALQSKSAFQQMALALAIAEKKLQFEHRDLHWGNILLLPTDDKFVTFKLNGNTLRIPSEGVQVTIIDYTLSRMFYDGIVLYNDLSSDDELFTAHGDYQFDIYRLMKDNLANDWQRFEPFNNVLWLHYIIDKLINGARYKSTKSRKHRMAIDELMVIRDELTNYKSALDSVTNI